MKKKNRNLLIIIITIFIILVLSGALDLSNQLSLEQWCVTDEDCLQGYECVLRNYEEYCYQESVDVANETCGAVDGGIVSCDFSLNPTNTYDGDWNTAGNGYGAESLSLTYQKPFGTDSANWLLSFCHGYGRFDEPIPVSCFNAYSTEIRLRILITGGGGAWLQCDDGDGGWEEDYFLTFGCSEFDVREEAVVWHMPTQIGECILEEPEPPESNYLILLGVAILGVIAIVFFVMISKKRRRRKRYGQKS